MRCPKCGCNDIETTCMGVINVGKPCKDTNRAKCLGCHHIGKAWEFGAPDFPPIKGTEDWGDEKIEQWHQDFRDGKIEFDINEGISIVNAKGIQQVEFDTDTKLNLPDSTIVLGE